MRGRLFCFLKILPRALCAECTVSLCKVTDGMSTVITIIFLEWKFRAMVRFY